MECALKSGGKPPHSKLAEEFGQEQVEMVDTIFALHRIAAAIVGGGLQAALNSFADVDVFPLNGIAEGDGLGGSFTGLF